MVMRQKVRANRMDKGNANAAGAVVATPQLAAAALLSPAARLVVTNKIQLWLLCSVLQVDSLLPKKISCGCCAQSCRLTRCYQQNSVVATVKHGLTFDLRSWGSKSKPCLGLLRRQLLVGRRILCTNLLQTYATNSLQALGECCLSWPHTRTLYFETRDPSPTRRQLQF
jgi:hypothetical protein